MLRVADSTSLELRREIFLTEGVEGRNQRLSDNYVGIWNLRTSAAIPTRTSSIGARNIHGLWLDWSPVKRLFFADVALGHIRGLSGKGCPESATRSLRHHGVETAYGRLIFSTRALCWMWEPYVKWHQNARNRLFGCVGIILPSWLGIDSLAAT